MTVINRRTLLLGAALSPLATITYISNVWSKRGAEAKDRCGGPGAGLGGRVA